MRPATVDCESLRRAVPHATILTAEADLRARARDWWPLARLREVRGDAPAYPSAVVLPATTQEVAQILGWATESSTAVVPRGLGSGVCGGVVPPEGSLVIDMSRMNRILEVDLVSQVTNVEAGIQGDVLEAKLNAQGLTVGHYPQSMALSSVGGWIAASGAGQAASGYGPIETRVLGMTVVLADGSVIRLPARPRTAAGPDLRRLLVGSEGILGIVTEASLACAPFDPDVSWQAFGYPSFSAVATASREINRAGVGPRIIRGYDEADSVAAFFAPFGHSEGCVGLVAIARSAPGLADRQATVAQISESAGSRPLDPAYGDHWWNHRFDAVTTFENIMGPRRALGPGSIIDTVEVAGLWRDLDAIYAAVDASLREQADEHRCHFSHVYPSGAALYFTFILRSTDDFSAEPHYLETWRSLMEACHGAGGTVAHHHGMGRLKAAALPADIGPESTELLRRVKSALDPAGILNPGALLTAPV